MTLTRTTPRARGRQSALRATLLGLELFIGLSAIYGAVMLAADAWHLPVDYLDPLPLHSWVLPGVALFVAVAAPMLAAAALVWRRAPRAAQASLAAGALLVGWIAAQLAIVGPRMWLQLIMAVLGLAVAGLACTVSSRPRQRTACPAVVTAGPRSRSNNARNGAGPSRCRAWRNALEVGSARPNPARPAVNCCHTCG
jgi:hypothetical protein